MSDRKYRMRAEKLKRALLEYLSANARHYGDMTRLEQCIEDLAQALNTRAALPMLLTSLCTIVISSLMMVFLVMVKRPPFCPIE